MNNAFITRELCANIERAFDYRPMYLYKGNHVS